MSSLRYWLWLSLINGMTVRKKIELLQYFGSPEKVFFSDKESLDKISLPPKTKNALLYKSMGGVQTVIEQCEKGGIELLALGDSQYPERLLNIADPPLVLYVKGKLPNVDEDLTISIVGTRSASAYGTQTAGKIAEGLAKAGVTVVTGLALGIDAAAARGALKAGGKVIGVLGTGVDEVYPAQNTSLHKEVSAHGALVSEYPPGTKGFASNFPARNRIISALSFGTVIVEAPKRSGALITASDALEQGRDLFVVPGNANSPGFVGSNELLKSGAIVTTKPEDVLLEYSALFPDIMDRYQQGQNAAFAKKENKKEIDNKPSVEYISLEGAFGKLTDDEKKILEVLNGKELQSDEIVAASGLPTGSVMAALTMLEIKGAVRSDAGDRFTIVVK